MHAGARLAGDPGGALADRSLRLLAQAVAASIALHALLLLLLPVIKEAQRRLPAPPLVARIVEPKPAPPRAEPAHIPEPPKPTPAPRLPPKAAAPAPQPVPVPQAPVLAIEPAAKPAAEAPAFSVPAAPPAQPRAPEAVASPPARTDAAPAPAGPDAGSVARFRVELMEVASRYKRYPRIARDNNWEGRVELRVLIAESGALSAVQVKKSSGRAILDEEAQAMIRTAYPHVPVPPALRGKAFVLEIPVDFALRDDAR